MTEKHDVSTSADSIPEEAIPTDQEQEINEGAITAFEGDYMEVTIDVADHLAKYEKAIDAILNFMIRRTYPGDWVSHDKDTTPLEERTVNPIGAAAERIARDLGISELNRTNPKKHMMDQEKNPGHYYFECEGDFRFRGRTIHAVGRASTLNPFHLAKAGGKPNEIREEYLLQECWRDCQKQGIKGLFGLRRIPIMKLKELGYDIAKVKFVNFKSKEGSQSAKNPDATAKPVGAETPTEGQEQVVMTIEGMTPKKSKNDKSFYSVKDTEGVSWYAWGDDKSAMIIDLLAALKEQKPIKVMAELGKYPTIRSIIK